VQSSDADASLELSDTQHEKRVTLQDSYRRLPSRLPAGYDIHIIRM
jgi:hypothetical protein